MIAAGESHQPVLAKVAASPDARVALGISPGTFAAREGAGAEAHARHECENSVSHSAACLMHLVLVLLALACAAAALKCPECEKTGQTSQVRGHGGISTMAYCNNYWDENGKYIINMCNTCTHDYSCSNGHHWSESEKCN
jgi:hypothetical protein